MKVDTAAEPEWDDQLQLMLDQPLIDPWSDTPDECSIDQPFGCIPGLERFKALIREDYYMAETLWAGVFCSLCVTVGMHMVKAYIIATLPPPPF